MATRPNTIGWRGEVVDRRDERLRNIHDAIEQHRRHDIARVLMHLRDQLLADQRRRHRIFVLHAALVDAHVLHLRGVGDTIPDEVVAALARAQVIAETGNRIGDDLLPLRPIQNEIREYLAQRLRREVGFVRRSAPDVVAGVDRLQFWGDLRAHAGADAVATHQDVGVFHAAAGELHAHAAFVLVDALEIPAEVIVRGIDGRPQQALQLVPRGHDLPKWPLLGDAAQTVERDALGDLDAEILGAGAGCFERVQQFGMCRDAGAAADQLDVRALVHVGVPADLAQERGAEQSRHRAADDDGAAFPGRSRHGGRMLVIGGTDDEFMSSHCCPPSRWEFVSSGISGRAAAG